MQVGQKIDYTKLRVGTVTQTWTYTDKKTGKKKTARMKVGKCPKCGRNGEIRIYKDKKTQEETSRSYKHVSEVDEVIPGFPLEHVREHCEVPVSVPGSK
jgi:hypothetical protein